VFNEVVRMVIDAYVEPVNVDRAMAGARLGLTEALDGESAYLNAEDFKTIQTPVKEADADVGLLLSRRLSFLMVISARPGSPADKAGVRPGDIVKTIDGRHTRPVSAPVGQRLLRGAPGSTVKMTLLRAASDPLDVTLVRERLMPLPVQGRMLEGGSGYVRVPEVSARTADEIRGEIETLRKGGAKNLVLDLRSSAGAPEDGVKIAELFLKGGVVTKLSGAKTPERLFNADPARQAWDRPVAVLLSHGSTGAAEIVAAALLDAARGPVVGERTFGRAPVQKTVPLEEGGLVITVARYASPKGTAIHGKGIEPTVIVESEEDEEPDSSAPKTDPILDKALEVLRGEVKKAA
jgi:carboxyl-terminal processing protease